MTLQHVHLTYVTFPLILSTNFAQGSFAAHEFWKQQFSSNNFFLFLLFIKFFSTLAWSWQQQHQAQMVLASICNVARINKHTIWKELLFEFLGTTKGVAMVINVTRMRQLEIIITTQSSTPKEKHQAKQIESNASVSVKVLTICEIKFYNYKWEPIGPMTNLNDGLKLELSSSSLVNHQNSNGEIESNIIVASSLQDHIKVIFWWQYLESTCNLHGCSSLAS